MTQGLSLFGTFDERVRPMHHVKCKLVKLMILTCTQKGKRNKMLKSLHCTER